MNILSKEQFLSIINFIYNKREQQNRFCDIIETLNYNGTCDSLIYADYEDNLVTLLEIMFSDKTDLIDYKLYEYDNFNDAEKEAQLKLTPEVETWESVYDYLLVHINDKDDD